MVYATGNGIATVLNGLSGFLAVRMVMPEVLGTYQTIFLFLGYLLIPTLGVHDGLNREVPFYLGQKDEEKANELAATAQGYMLLLSVLSLVGFGVTALYYLAHADMEYAAGYAALAISAFQVFIGQSYLNVTYRTHGKFTQLSWILSLSAMLNMVLVLAVWAFGYYGLCLRTAGVAFGTLALAYVGRPLRLRPRLSWASLKGLIVVGAPIFVGLQLNTLWLTLNRTLILSELGERALGLFALYYMIYPALMLVPTAVSQVIYQKLAHMYGQGKNMAELIRYSSMPLLLLTGIMIAGISILSIILPYLVEFLLPNYAEGIDAVRWMIWDMVIYSALQTRLIFFLFKKQSYYLSSIVFGMAVHGAALWYFLPAHPVLEIFPQTMLLGRAANLVLCLALLYVLARRERRASSV